MIRKPENSLCLASSWRRYSVRSVSVLYTTHMSLASGWGVQPLDLWTVCSPVVMSCRNRRKQHPLNTHRLFNVCMHVCVCLQMDLCNTPVSWGRLRTFVPPLKGPWDFIVVNSTLLSVFAFLQSCRSFCYPRPLILHLNCILQPCQKAIPFITTTFIHHSLFLSCRPHN